MPMLGAQPDGRTPIRFTEDAAVFVKIGEIKYLLVRYPPFHTLHTGFAPNVNAWRIKPPEEPRKGDLLLVPHVLTGQHAHRVLVHGALDRLPYVFVDRLTH